VPDVSITSNIVANGTALITLYWACAIVGLGLLLVSLLGGLHHAGIDFHADAGGLPDVHGHIPADVHADVDIHAGAGVHGGGADALHGAGLHHHTAEAHAGSSVLATWFSIRFCIFFIAVFGAVGLVLTHMTQTVPSTAFGVSLLSGLVVGQAVHRLFRKICQTSGDSTPSVGDYVNQIGRVTVAVAQGRVGEVAVSVRGCQRYIPATGKRADASFQAGEEVAVVEYNGGVAVIVPRKEFEFLQDAKKA
jgi:membrane protein implicated in regulation of membrane protease activity